MAFEPGRGRTAVPVRSALAGTAIAVAAVVAAAVFGASLAGLVSSPRQYGQNWDQQLSLGFAAVPASYAAHFAAAAPDVTGYALGDIGQLSIGGTRVAAVGVDPVHGDGYLTMLAGRPPANAGRDRARRADACARSARGSAQTVRARGRPGRRESSGLATQYVLRVDWHGRSARLRPAGLSSDTDLGNGAVVSPRCCPRPSELSRLHDRARHLLQPASVPLPAGHRHGRRAAQRCSPPPPRSAARTARAR